MERPCNRPTLKGPKMKIYKKYDSEKGRTTPISDVEGHSVGFLGARDASAIKNADAPQCDAVTVKTAIYSAGSSLVRTFQMVRYGKELVMVSGDGPKTLDACISLTTHAAFNHLLTKYDKDPRWTQVNSAHDKSGPLTH